ncbi:hypothetical protein N7524_011548 [Penicillium chrysogenum]|jgi:hypothetical protein
MKLPI